MYRYKYSTSIIIPLNSTGTIETVQEYEVGKVLVILDCS